MAVTIAYEYPTNVAPVAGQANLNCEFSASVTTDGTATTFTVTHNMGISAADLALGLPEVTFEPLGNNFGTIAPFIASKDANTVVLTFTATAGTFRIRVKTPNTATR